MSGRKSGEVASVLRQGEKVRQMTDALYDEQIEKDLRELVKCVQDANEQKLKAIKQEIELYPETTELFELEATKKYELFCDLRQQISSVNFSENPSEEINLELRKLDDELKKADMKAEEIRTAIKAKRNGWYCDEEYKQAQDLVAKYNKLRDRRVELSHRAIDFRQDIRKKINQLTADIHRMQNLYDQLNDMNEIAKRHQESNVMRESLQQMIQNIPKEEAEKFFAGEFSKLKDEIEGAIADTDDKLIEVFQEKYNHISDFNGKLTARISLWKQQKADAEGALQEVKDLADFALIGPVEYFNKKEKGEKTPLFDYLKQYSGQDLEPEYLRLMRKAEREIKKEEFTSATEVLSEVGKMVREARDAAAALQESMLKKTELAGAIQKVMYDMKYSVKTRIIDDNPNNGYRITCTVGDEIIDFDHVDIDDDGKVVMNIDHTESIGGTCKSSWSEIAQRMLDAGIPITNVTMSNGRSVLRQEQHRKSETQKMGQKSH